MAYKPFSGVGMYICARFCSAYCIALLHSCSQCETTKPLVGPFVGELYRYTVTKQSNVDRRLPVYMIHRQNRKEHKMTPPNSRSMCTDEEPVSAARLPDVRTADCCRSRNLPLAGCGGLHDARRRTRTTLLRPPWACACAPYFGRAWG